MGGLEDVDYEPVVHQPAKAIAGGCHDWRMFSIEPKIVVNNPAKGQEDSTESLDADQFVDNSVTLSLAEPRPEEVGIHWNIDRGLQQQDWIHGILAYQIRYEKLIFMFG